MNGIIRPGARWLAAFFLGVAATAGAQTPSEVPPAASCSDEAFRQLDFWVGEWDVYPKGGDRKIATSLIESLYGGCAVRENWMPLGRPGGGSLNTYVQALKVWRQVWTDSRGSWNEFEGGFTDGSMVLVGHRLGADPGMRRVLARLTFTPLEDGSVRQLGEHSADFGKTWDVTYDFIYKSRSEKGGEEKTE